MNTCDNFQPVTVESVHLYHACMLAGSDDDTECICILPIDRQDPEKGMLITAMNGHTCFMVTDTTRPCGQEIVINTHYENANTMKLIKKSGVCTIEKGLITIPVMKQQAKVALHMRNALPTWIDAMRRIFTDYEIPDYYADHTCIDKKFSYSVETIEKLCKIMQNYKVKGENTKAFKIQQIKRKKANVGLGMGDPLIIRAIESTLNLCIIVMPMITRDEPTMEEINKGMDDTQKNILSALF